MKKEGRKERGVARMHLTTIVEVIKERAYKLYHYKKKRKRGIVIVKLSLKV